MDLIVAIGSPFRKIEFLPLGKKYFYALPESPCSTVGHEVVCAPVTAPDDNLVERGSVGSPHHSVDTSSSDDDFDCSCYADDGSVLPFGSFLLYTDNGKRHTFRVQCPGKLIMIQFFKRFQSFFSDGRYIRVPTLGENCSAETALKLSENFEQALYSEMLSAALADNIDVASSLVVGNHFIAEDRSMEESSDSSICLSPAKKDRAAGSMTGYDSETMMDDGSGGRECCSNESGNYTLPPYKLMPLYVTLVRYTSSETQPWVKGFRLANPQKIAHLREATGGT